MHPKLIQFIKHPIINRQQAREQVQLEDMRTEILLTLYQHIPTAKDRKQRTEMVTELADSIMGDYPVTASKKDVL